MTPTSPRLDPRLVLAVFALDEPGTPMAETWRAVCSLADELGVPRPGYDTIRRLVHTGRRREAELRRVLEPVAADLLQGRFDGWDIDRLREAAAIARADRRRHA
jgi:hypothetical protein